MKIVFTAKGTDMSVAMDPRFGRTEYFVIFDEESKTVESFDNRAIEKEAHGAGPRTAQKLSEYGAQVLITGNGPGGNAAAVLKTLGLEIYVGAGTMTVQEAYDAYKSGSLTKA
ncbi:MAG: dinitrogenase iron-molybdenum cofactor biosynthesis protein [Spirochaetaceae bacterium 4572_59]|nr:MAG: dinitrogenase iron-molybdenum cofactor biosynthesis protein [Spirochaetaceae bacterium 4572_59]